MLSEVIAYYQSPIGTLELIGNENMLHTIHFVADEVVKNTQMPVVLQSVGAQLDEYFQGQRQIFSIKYQFKGTEFQKRVWEALAAIPFGQTISYRELARRIGNEKAARAVGLANSQNQLPILIPCHRVIGIHGNLTGYAGGLWRKAWLLKHEGVRVDESI
jgi:methylated-DNA-[protein]-cysteine S-methyltransferase